MLACRGMSVSFVRISLPPFLDHRGRCFGVTGITTQDPKLMAGLHVPTKAERVARYHEKTVHVALEITGALGYEVPPHAG